tara:strand:- start:354 stop:548 length:195 start_codon:yes stop_codon:yes gene_type:complete
MPKVGRAKYHSSNLASNTGKGYVNNKLSGQGRGRVIRGAILSRSMCVSEGCYNSIGMMPKMGKK